jgi:fermentation-respiration switch protein FrsA (DUF1100 family)
VGLLDAEELTLSTEDGLELGAWYLPPARPEGPWVLVAQGNGGNRSLRAPLAGALADAGLGVLLFDYRGYGGNPGAPSEEGLLRDARAARRALVDDLGADPARLVYFGESLGGGVATALALEQPPAALVLRSPFTSLADVGRLHYPFLPVDALLRDRYPVAEQVRRYRGPVLILAGAGDTIVPPDQSRRVAGAAGAEFVLLPGGHNDPGLLDGAELVAEVVAFLRREVP